MKINDPITPQPPQSGCIASICRCSTKEEHASRAVSYATESASADLARMSKEADARVAAANKKAADLAALTPDANQYVIEKVERVGDHLAMQIRYPNCKLCAYEGLKTMVFLDVSEAAALKWRRIDPHFRGATSSPIEAPSPAARFPGSKDGWADAVAYARGKKR